MARKPAARGSALRQAVVSAVYADFDDRNCRNKNTVINGLRVEGNGDKNTVEKLLIGEFSLLTTIVKCRRLGRKLDGKIQPILVAMPSVAEAECLIYDAKRLSKWTNENVKSSLFINADLTKAEA